MAFEAFVYGWRNQENGKMYIGFRKNSDVNDGYIFSSVDPELKSAWGLGNLHRSILFRGSVSDAITMERKLLKHADARRNSKFYNKSNGGGAGIRDYNTISDEEAQVGIDWINGIDPVEEDPDIFNLVDTDVVDDIWEAVKEGKYEVYETPAIEIANYAQNQVRLIMIDQNHVNDIAERMKHDPVEARKNISPIIVCVSKDGTRTIIDGNHTSRAVAAAGWVSAPVIFINSSEFLDKQSNIDHFGIIANHNPKIKKPNSSQDCQRAIINLYSRNLRDGDTDFKNLTSEKFKTTCEEILYPQWTKSQISANLKSAIERIKTDAAHADLNFQTYSKPDLDALIRQITDKDPKMAVVSVTSGSIYNAGLGAILNKTGEMDVWKGVIITHHAGIGDYERWAESEKKLKKAMKRVHPDCKIKYVVLNSFKKQTKVKI
jgi:vacuolar-type H+-ATPase subunit F/Vma7